MTESRAHRSRPTRERGGRSRKAGDFGARMVAALAVFAIMWTGSVASAAVADRSPTPAPVKYFVVPARGNGPASLSEIAGQTLGNSSRFMQIFRLNKGRLQPNGGRLENPGLIEPGWVLELPPTASGPGVRFGPLPQPAPSASAAPPSRPPSRPGAASSSSPVALIVTILVLVIASALAVIGARLAWRPRRGRRRRVAEGTRGRRHGRFDRPRTPAEPPSMLADATDSAAWSWPSRMATPADWPADHPSRPQQAVDYRAWPADHPSRPQQAVDYRAWPADHPSRPQQAVDYRAWPADHPSRPQQAVGYERRPYGGPTDPGGWAGPGPATPARSGSTPLNQPARAPLPPLSRTSPPSFAPAPGRAAGVRAEDLDSTDALRVASMLLSEAEAEADRIRAEATAFREQATTQAVSVREAAEREAAKLRASLQAMSAELSQLAASVTRTLEVPAEPGTATPADMVGPASRAQAIPDTPARSAAAGRPGANPPVSAPKARTATKPDDTPSRERGTRHRTSPGSAPKTSPAAKPGERPRQLRAARIVVAAFIGLSLLSAATGTTEIFLHGFPFFVFRSAGTGGTPSNGRQEDQGPGQPDAPGAHHHTAPRHHQDHHQRSARGHAGGSTH